ncbi:hypothetical protein [Streptomyces kronopolitis]
MVVDEMGIIGGIGTGTDIDLHQAAVIDDFGWHLATEGFETIAEGTGG